MIVCAMVGCLVQCSYAAQPYVDGVADARMLWLMAATLLAFAFPFVLRARHTHPEPVFWACLAIVVVFPYDPLLMLMALASLLARRSSPRRTVRAVAAGSLAAAWAQARDAMRPADESVWHQLFARPGTGVDGVPLHPMAGDTAIVVTALVFALAETAVAVLLGLHIRSRALARTAQAQAQAAADHAATLQTDLHSQQLADAIAAEAHDTLAHSLSLLALNASALKAEAAAFPDSREARSIAQKADDIRRQAAGALDEAHAIIGMLRDPRSAWEQLAPSEQTALTRESLDALLGEARTAGMQLNSWIDIERLSILDDGIAKVAYRVIQECLTNARRHAPGQPVSLEVAASPASGVHVHCSNPQASAEDGDTGGGMGLAGLAARAQAVGGMCRHGVDERGIFHVEVNLPWVFRGDPGADGTGQETSAPVIGRDADAGQPAGAAR
ncbi:sensor histidine kinase [Bifidobacterium pullorum subsp. saeculare]|uniref:histidine kinase n=1 Tax=Bifidobacterium pullorum subsp. saeculare TaxID=78257 RepID=A0A938WZA2_9BIFI|nr:histidine kinase [Bifidobacterium pullorum]MBM6700408.1 sensor histidine kinase [Bifidobacterium pullorum subsp. saeculare]